MQTEYSVLDYKTEIEVLEYLEYKFGIEVDELGHNNRSIEYEIQRQKEIEKLTSVCVY